MTKSIKALLLSAGFGTRLRPLTYEIPKCLVEINGETILKRWLNQLSKINCEECLINTHYLANKVDEYIKTIAFQDMKIKLSYEPKILGTAGSFLDNLTFFKGSTGILMHSDNVTNFELKNLLKAHRERAKGTILTMLTFESSNPTAAGIVEKDQSGIMINFHEKVSNPPSNCANGAIYVFEDDFIDWIQNNKRICKDFSLDILPNLINRVQTYHTGEVYLDIGTPETLALAQSIFNKKIK